MTRSNATTRRILMLIQNNGFPNDIRVNAEATVLSEAGHQVFVVCPRRSGQTLHERTETAEVFRYPASPSMGGMLGYIVEYAYSLITTVVLALYVFARRKFDVIHAANPPDLFFVVAWLFKPFGVAYVFDHHDLTPEMLRARFGSSAPRVLERGLRLLERLSFRAADLVVSTNESYRQIAVDRGGVASDRVVVVRNGPDLGRVRLVEPDVALRRRARTILGYVGVMGRQDGVDILVRAVAHLVHDMQRDVAAVLVGHGDQLEPLRGLAVELGVDDRIRFTGRLVGEDLMRQLSTADICVDPDPSNAYNDASSMIKMSEYMALGKPIVAFDLPEHRVTAGDCALYAVPNRPEDLAKEIAVLIDDPESGVEMGRRGRQAVEAHLGWHRQAPRLIEAYERILCDRSNSAARPSAGSRDE